MEKYILSTLNKKVSTLERALNMLFKEEKKEKACLKAIESKVNSTEGKKVIDGGGIIRFSFAIEIDKETLKFYRIDQRSIEDYCKKGFTHYRQTKINMLGIAYPKYLKYEEVYNEIKNYEDLKKWYTLNEEYNPLYDKEILVFNKIKNNIIILAKEKRAYRRYIIENTKGGLKTNSVSLAIDTSYDNKLEVALYKYNNYIEALKASMKNC